MIIYSTTELRTKTTELLDKAIDKPLMIRTMRITRRGDESRPPVIMMSLEEYERLTKGVK